MTTQFQYKADQYLKEIIAELDDFRERAIRLTRNLATIDKIVKNWQDIRNLEARSPNQIENINPDRKNYEGETK